MEKISKERRGAIRAAAEKATPGPWEVGPVDDTVVTHLGADGLRYEVAGIDGDYNSPDEWPTMEANAAHIANCDPQTILALLDALDAPEAREVAVKPLEWGPQTRAPDGPWSETMLRQRIGHHHLGRYAGSYSIQEMAPGGPWGWWCSWTSDNVPEGVEKTEEAAMASCQADYEARIWSVLHGPKPTHRHVKRGSEYVLIGYGRMQAGGWWQCITDEGEEAADMREVAIYRSVDDGSLWVRPREEFEDGRFVQIQEPTK